MHQTLNAFCKYKFLTLALLVGTGASAADLSNYDLDAQLDEAYVRTQDEQLIAGTGTVERRWRWVNNGLQTCELKNLAAGKEWVTASPFDTADWCYTTLTDGDGRLVSLTAQSSDDEGFAPKHLELVAEVEYDQVAVQYIVWVYPGADGFRTQLKIRRTVDERLGSKLKYDVTPKKQEYDVTSSSDILTGRTERLPLKTDGATIRAAGYYNHTQGRNRADTALLHEELVDGGTVAWASILSLEQADGGVMLVKESHKCVNQAGVNTGVFNIAVDKVEATGWGILPQDLTKDFQGYWANWLIVHDASTPEGRELALKQFDRIRYPVDPARDIYIMANTWGTGETKNWSQKAAREENVMVEIDSQADLGLDVQQIDDGWQGPKTGSDSWRPVPVLDFGKNKNQKKSEDGEVQLASGERVPMYPEGWKNVKAHAAEKGLRLGLWVHSKIPLEDLKWNFDNGGFKSYKVDFVSTRNFNQLDALMQKVRAFVKYTDHQVRLNWDVTEHPPRIGYYFGREYGNIYLENRKTLEPAKVVYVPWLVLRDAWQVAKYTNLNKFQITVQNGDRCNQEVSDAHQHPHGYLTAQALMGSPIFFQETHYYSDEARAQIKPVIHPYRKVRDEMYQGYVFPIGDEPDNKSWSGFQNVNPDSNVGFVILYRQIENGEPSKMIQLKFVSGKIVTLKDLMSGETMTVKVPADGVVEFDIEEAADFRFYRYTVDS